MVSKQVIALAKRINEELGMDADPETFSRTYAGKWQREAGAYTWIMYPKHMQRGMIGGFEPISKYISKKNKLDFVERGFNIFAIYAYSPDEEGYEKRKCLNKADDDEDFEVEIDFERNIIKNTKEK